MTSKKKLERQLSSLLDAEANWSARYALLNRDEAEAVAAEIRLSDQLAATLASHDALIIAHREAVMEKGYAEIAYTEEISRLREQVARLQKRNDLQSSLLGPVLHEVAEYWERLKAEAEVVEQLPPPEITGMGDYSLDDWESEDGCCCGGCCINPLTNDNE